MKPDYFKLSLRNIGKRRLRSGLTIIGIVISIAVIFTLISLSVGLKEAVNEQFKTLGTDKFFVMPKGQLGAPGTGGAVELTLDDVKILRNLRGVKAVSYASVGNGKIEFGRKIRYTLIIGLPLDLEAKKVFVESSNIKVDEGRMIDSGDSGKVMLGYDYKYGKIFDSPLRARSKIIVNGREFQVVGILGKIGNPSDDRNIFLSEDDFKKMFNSSDRVDQIIAQVSSGEDVKEVSDRAKERLMRARGVTEKTIDFTVSTPEELLQNLSSILNLITGFLLGVAGISLLVGGVGIMNTMYTSVLERTREIGTMKAVGARNKDILYIFVIESGMLGLVGGVIGVGLGYLISKTVEIIAINSLGTSLLKAAAPIWLIAGCLAFAFLIGSASGFFPAYRASRVKPVDALRYE